MSAVPQRVIMRNKAIANAISNGGNVKRAMIDAGYSVNTASGNAKRVTSSKEWQEYMDKFLPDGLLAEKHNELLTVPRKIRTYKRGVLQIETEELHVEAIKAGLEMGYKLKGRYNDEKQDTKVVLLIDI